jgi:hypothetical protein
VTKAGVTKVDQLIDVHPARTTLFPVSVACPGDGDRTLARGNVTGDHERGSDGSLVPQKYFVMFQYFRLTHRS